MIEISRRSRRGPPSSPRPVRSAVMREAKSRIPSLIRLRPSPPMSPPELSDTPSEFSVKARMVGKRIDAYLASRYPDYSRSVIRKVIEAGAVLVNGQPTKASYRVRLDDVIRVWLPELADDA